MPEEVRQVEETPARTREQRLADTRRLLETEIDCWVATASGDGAPHLVPLSFGWQDGKITLATPRRYRTVRNLLANGRVKIALGALRDVVVVDGTAVVRDLTEVPDAVLDEFVAQGDWDPRESDENAFIEVTPHRIMAWRQENELAGRVLMRGGEWIEEDA